MKGKLNKSWLSFLYGSVFVLIFGWPIFGAASSLWWPEGVFDAKGPKREAAERIGASSWSVYARFIEERFGRYRFEEAASCENRAKGEKQNLLQKQDAFLWNIAVSRNAALGRWAAMLERNNNELPIMQYIDNLPSPLLGALDGCLTASLASPLCQRYADHLMEVAIQQTAKERAFGILQVNRRAEEIWCYSIGDIEKLRLLERSAPRQR